MVTLQQVAYYNNVWVISVDSSTTYQLAADAVLLLHVLFVVFVVFGLVLIFVGRAFAWSWVRNPWFRLIHLVSIAVVVIQSWLSIICPLTSIEMTLRSRAGDVTYTGSFIAHWLESVLYYRAPPWVFVVCYTAFGAAVVASWVWVRPRRF
jgi:hypothetical protein